MKTEDYAGTGKHFRETAPDGRRGEVMKVTRQRWRTTTSSGGTSPEEGDDTAFIKDLEETWNRQHGQAN